jgi:uncharacterized glyoxalase superfamily protein PhnB
LAAPYGRVVAQNPPVGGASARPFLSARDFATSKAFYAALRFGCELDTDEVAIYRVGTTSFLLQNHYQQQWAENCMMQLMVDDLDAWWDRIVALDLPTRFGVAEPTPPATPPWGLRVAYVVDPCGVLWHVAQRRPDTPHDR